MWFKNLLIYRLTQDLPFDAEALETALASKLARPCASQELTTYGFVAPFGKGEDAPLVHVSQDFLLIAARKEERILPGSVVRDALKEKVEEIEAEQMRKVYKRNGTSSRMKSSRRSCRVRSSVVRPLLPPSRRNRA
ncbi:Recombination-associated protein [Pseudomonas brassicacearum subsp. brassicacearum NFM421]|uniref:Recombination-associated protein RdgC n=1 Tax=Pseudomonas brassicacearum (strain NFM421) TaxID=994484 RepID=F2KKG9_PSEBN|nr:Recombination-associated protein [Pseudomonas brassicacearum subsp. brassicacearum NFM421]